MGEQLSSRLSACLGEFIPELVFLAGYRLFKDAGDGGAKRHGIALRYRGERPPHVVGDGEMHSVFGGGHRRQITCL